MRKILTDFQIKHLKPWKILDDPMFPDILNFKHLQKHYVFAKSGKLDVSGRALDAGPYVVFPPFVWNYGKPDVSVKFLLEWP